MPKKKVSSNGDKRRPFPQERGRGGENRVSEEYMHPVYLEIGARIRWLRKEKGWSARSLGKRCGTHQTTICSWEQAKARVPLHGLVLIANALGAPIELFLADLDPADCQPPPALHAARLKKSKVMLRALKKSRQEAKPNGSK